MYLLLSWRSAFFLVLLIYLAAMPAHAARLEISVDANPVFKWGAHAILYTHILGGAIGLIAGVAASFAKKGRKLHKSAGRIFVVAMLACYTIGALVAPFLAEGQRPNFVAAVLALYLLISGVSAARKKPYRSGLGNALGLLIALSITSMGLLFMYMGSQSETGTVDGAPPQSFVVFIIAGTLASFGEIKAMINKTLSESARITRHLWRMCLSFFFASGSLFIGQPQVFPDWFNTSPLPGLLAFFPIIVLIIWSVKIGWKKRHPSMATDGAPSALP